MSLGGSAGCQQLPLGLSCMSGGCPALGWGNEVTGPRISHCPVGLLSWQQGSKRSNRRSPKAQAPIKSWLAFHVLVPLSKASHLAKRQVNMEGPPEDVEIKRQKRSWDQAHLATAQVLNSIFQLTSGYLGMFSCHHESEWNIMVSEFAYSPPSSVPQLFKMLSRFVLSH